MELNIRYIVLCSSELELATRHNRRPYVYGFETLLGASEYIARTEISSGGIVCEGNHSICRVITEGES
jgi:hypothetical protein